MNFLINDSMILFKSDMMIEKKPKIKYISLRFEREKYFPNLKLYDFTFILQ